MFLAFLLLNIVHPGWVLRGPSSEFPRMSRKEKKHLRREKKEAKKAAKGEKKAAKRDRKQRRAQRNLYAEEDIRLEAGSTDRLELIERGDSPH